MTLHRSHRISLFSILSLLAACPDKAPEDTATATETPSPTTTDPTEATPTTGASDTDTTGGEFSMCKDPDPKADVGFVFDPGTLPIDADVDIVCSVDGGVGGGEFSAALELTCVDGMSVAHAVKIGFKLFSAPKLAALGEAQVRLRYTQPDTFGQDDEMLAINALDDTLLVFAVDAFDPFRPELAALWVPLKFAQVDELLCDVEASCYMERRTAVDVTVGDSSERLFDRDHALFATAAISVHVGAAHLFELGSLDECGGTDAPTGLAVTLVAVAEGT